MCAPARQQVINTKGHSESTFARKAFDKLPLVQMNSQYTLGLSTILPLECDNEGGVIIRDSRVLIARQPGGNMANVFHVSEISLLLKNYEGTSENICHITHGTV